MIFEKVYLDNEPDDVYLECYVADPIGSYQRKGILVIPGGGYGAVCSDREGEPIAMAFLPHGYHAFVLHYSVARTKTFPSQLIQASKAMKYIRDHAKQWQMDPDNIFVTGFSAGGHLAGSLGTMWHKKEVYEAIEMPYGYNKPAGMILVYPVVSGIGDYTHPGSFQNLLGTDTPAQEQLAMCSLQCNVDERSVPLYLIHTSNDNLVNIQNSLVLAQAYGQRGMLFEMHVYPDAPHGVALANEITECGNPGWKDPCIAKWVENAALWAEKIKIVAG